MSKRFYPWWPYIKSIIQEYPELNKKEKFSNVETQNWRAVFDAIFSTEKMQNGEYRIRAISLLHWDKTHTLDGVGDVLHYSRSYVARWQREFFEEVARNRGLIE